MKGLKLAIVLGVVFFAANASAFKLKIVKKSATIGHNIVDQIDLESSKVETTLRDQFDRYSSNDISIEGIKEKEVKRVQRQTATYKAKVKPVKIDAESLIEENDISDDLPADSANDERTVQRMNKSIKDEFEDEISMSEELDDQNSLSSASTGY